MKNKVELMGMMMMEKTREGCVETKKICIHSLYPFAQFVLDVPIIAISPYLLQELL